MTANIRNGNALALIYGTRDNYVGEFQPPVADIRGCAASLYGVLCAPAFGRFARGCNSLALVDFGGAGGRFGRAG